MGRYRFTRAAADDITAIFIDGIEHFGLAAADTYHEGLGNSFAFLAEHPRAARLRTELEPPVRALRYKAHLIFYDAISDDEILILRVRHCREDWMGEGER